MAAFLCFMGVRLIAMRRVLKDTGSIYLHCDPTASHYLKTLMDAIFERRNFRNEIIWCYNKWSNTATFFQRNHDVILFYAAGEESVFNKQYGEPTERMLKIRESGYNGGSKDGQPILRVYDASNPKAQAQISSGKYAAYRIYYIDEPAKGAPVPDYWQISTLNSQAGERTGYPTQKPLALYERIIAASTNEGDVVLDPFAGCATTVVAAEKMGRRWVAMDIWEGSHDVVRNRIQNEVRLTDDGEEYHVKLETKPPARTDDGHAVPFLRLPERRPSEPWQRLTRATMRDELAIAQRGFGDGIVCAGCGRERDLPEMELDHRRPRTDGGDNWITNRVLLCGPCNRRKGAGLTMTGLVRANKKDGWTRNADAASRANAAAIDRAESIRERGGIEPPAEADTPLAA